MSAPYEVVTFGPLDDDEEPHITMPFQSLAKARETFDRLCKRGKDGIGVKIRSGSVTIVKFTQVAETE